MLPNCIEEFFSIFSSNAADSTRREADRARTRVITSTHIAALERAARAMDAPREDVEIVDVEGDGGSVLVIEDNRQHAQESARGQGTLAPPPVPPRPAAPPPSAAAGAAASLSTHQKRARMSQENTSSLSTSSTTTTTTSSTNNNTIMYQPPQQQQNMDQPAPSTSRARSPMVTRSYVPHPIMHGTSSVSNQARMQYSGAGAGVGAGVGDQAYPGSSAGAYLHGFTQPRVNVESFKAEVASQILKNNGHVQDVPQLCGILFDPRAEIKFADPITVRSYVREGGMASLLVREAMAGSSYVAVKEGVLNKYMDTVARCTDALEQVLKKIK